MFSEPTVATATDIPRTPLEGLRAAKSTSVQYHSHSAAGRVGIGSLQDGRSGACQLAA